MGRSAVGTAAGAAVLQGGALLSPILGGKGGLMLVGGRPLGKGRVPPFREGSVYCGGRAPSPGWAPRKSSGENPRSLHRRRDLRDGS